jgi:hypothetical protein
MTTSKTPSKELSIGEILSLAWDKFTKHFMTIAGIVLIVYIPINLITYYLPEFLPDTGVFSNVKTQMKIMQIIEGLFGVLSLMAIAIFIKESTKDQLLTIRESLEKSVARWVPVIVTGFISGIFLLGLYLLLIVPGIIYSIYWIFIVWIVALNDMTGTKALAYSKSIVKGRWWRVLKYSFVFGLLGLLIGMALGFVSALYLPEGMVFEIVFYTIIDIVDAFFIVVLTIFYLSFEGTKLESPEKPEKA